MRVFLNKKKLSDIIFKGNSVFVICKRLVTIPTIIYISMENVSV